MPTLPTSTLVMAVRRIEDATREHGPESTARLDHRRAVELFGPHLAAKLLPLMGVREARIGRVGRLLAVDTATLLLNRARHYDRRPTRHAAEVAALADAINVATGRARGYWSDVDLGRAWAEADRVHARTPSMEPGPAREWLRRAAFAARVACDVLADGPDLLDDALELGELLVDDDAGSGRESVDSHLAARLADCLDELADPRRPSRRAAALALAGAAS